MRRFEEYSSSKVEAEPGGQLAAQPKVGGLAQTPNFRTGKIPGCVRPSKFFIGHFSHLPLIPGCLVADNAVVDYSLTYSFITNNTVINKIRTNFTQKHSICTCLYDKNRTKLN